MTYADNMNKPARRQIPAWVYPVGTVLLALVLWQIAVKVFTIPTYLLPAPTVILKEFAGHWQFLLKHTWVTFSEAVAGVGLSILIGVPVAILLVWSPFLNRAFTPLLIVSQTFPKVAIAPLLVIWFGLGFFPKALVSFLIAFFPVVVAGVQGMRSVEPEMLELIHSYRANAFQIFWKIRLPFALPSLFSGFKLAATFSVIGAVVGEWVGADKGLGYVLLWANSDLDTPLVFAAVVCLAGMGSLLYYTVHGLERLALPWHVSVQAGRSSEAMLTQ